MWTIPNSDTLEQMAISTQIFSQKNGKQDIYEGVIFTKKESIADTLKKNVKTFSDHRFCRTLMNVSEHLENLKSWKVFTTKYKNL